MKLIKNCNRRYISLKINAKFMIVTSGKDKVLPIPLRCLKVVFLKSLRKDDFSDIDLSLSHFCGSVAMKSSILGVS